MANHRQPSMYRGKRRSSVQWVGVWCAALSIFVGAAMVQPGIAEASTGPVVMVDEHLSGRYDVLLRRAIHFTDRFTMSRMVLGPCVSGARCITIKNDTGLPMGRGNTEYRLSDPRRMSTTITFHLGSGYTGTQVTRLMEHELGHAFGLEHVNACNIMKPIVQCHRFGVPYTPAERFTAEQRKVLSKW